MRVDGRVGEPEALVEPAAGGVVRLDVEHHLVDARRGEVGETGGGEDPAEATALGGGVDADDVHLPELARCAVSSSGTRAARRRSRRRAARPGRTSPRPSARRSPPRSIAPCSGCAANAAALTRTTSSASSGRYDRTVDAVRVRDRGQRQRRRAPHHPELPGALEAVRRGEPGRRGVVAVRPGRHRRRRRPSADAASARPSPAPRASGATARSTAAPCASANPSDPASHSWAPVEAVVLQQQRGRLVERVVLAGRDAAAAYVRDDVEVGHVSRPAPARRREDLLGEHRRTGDPHAGQQVGLGERAPGRALRADRDRPDARTVPQAGRPAGSPAAAGTPRRGPAPRTRPPRRSARARPGRPRRPRSRRR